MRRVAALHLHLVHELAEKGENALVVLGVARTRLDRTRERERIHRCVGRQRSVAATAAAGTRTIAASGRATHTASTASTSASAPTTTTTTTATAQTEAERCGRELPPQI